MHVSKAVIHCGDPDGQVTDFIFDSQSFSESSLVHS